jgi:hypothetical protein
LSVIVAATPVVDILTALSLLYLYHILGLKNRRQIKAERGSVSFNGLINTEGREYILETEDEKKDLSNQLYKTNYSGIVSEDLTEGPN